MCCEQTTYEACQQQLQTMCVLQHVEAAPSYPIAHGQYHVMMQLASEKCWKFREAREVQRRSGQCWQLREIQGNQGSSGVVQGCCRG